MPRTILTPTEITAAGVAPSFVAADQANGMQFNNDGHTLLEVKDTGGGACTVTISANGSKVAGGAITIPNLTVSVPATTGDRLIGPFDCSIFNQAGGVVYVDFSTGTGVTITGYHINV